MGLVGSMGMTGNMLLRSYDKGGMIISKKEPRKLAEKIKEDLGVKMCIRDRYDLRRRCS